MYNFVTFQCRLRVLCFRQYFSILNYFKLCSMPFFSYSYEIMPVFVHCLFYILIIHLCSIFCFVVFFCKKNNVEEPCFSLYFFVFYRNFIGYIWNAKKIDVFIMFLHLLFFAISHILFCFSFYLCNFVSFVFYLHFIDYFTLLIRNDDMCNLNI